MEVGTNRSDAGSSQRGGTKTRHAFCTLFEIVTCDDIQGKRIAGAKGKYPAKQIVPKTPKEPCTTDVCFFRSASPVFTAGTWKSDRVIASLDCGAIAYLSHLSACLSLGRL